jgi:hypothetical protein
MFGTDSNSNEAEQAIQENRGRGEKSAENIRDGEAISEHGFGGETVGNEGEVNQGSNYGRVEMDRETQGKQARREQGCGEGSGL